MSGYLIWCYHCERPIEGVLVATAVRQFRAHEPMAAAHEQAYGHYPSKAFSTPADATALRRAGGGE
jgi:hypothetical protein